MLEADTRDARAPGLRRLQGSCSDRVDAEPGLRPPGPSDAYHASADLLGWIGENLDRFGDIFKARAFGGDIYVVNHPDYIQHVLRRNWRNYRKGFAIKKIGLLLGRGLMVSEGELWKTQRKLIQPAFHRSAIEALVEIMNAANRDLVRRWERAASRRESVNVTRDTSTMALNTVLMSLFGADFEALEPHFRVLTEEAARNLELVEAFKALRAIVGELVTRRRRDGDPSPDMLAMLMGLRDAAGRPAMSDSQLISEVMTTVVAGHETTASTLNWTWYLLSQHSRIEQRLHAEVDAVVRRDAVGFADMAEAPLSRQVLEEAMRLYPAGWLMTRRALNDDQLGAYFVPAGTEIYIAPYFMQRHAGFWDNPDRFDPDRFGPERSQDRPELAMLPFSAGPRNCIGEPYARTEMQVHLMTVARRLRLSYDGPAPELDVGVNLRSKHDVIMKPELRA
jgi:cytochrome P450